MTYWSPHAVARYQAAVRRQPPEHRQIVILTMTNSGRPLLTVGTVADLATRLADLTVTDVGVWAVDPGCPGRIVPVPWRLTAPPPGHGGVADVALTVTLPDGVEPATRWQAACPAHEDAL